MIDVSLVDMGKTHSGGEQGKGRSELSRPQSPRGIDDGNKRYIGIAGILSMAVLAWWFQFVRERLAASSAAFVLLVVMSLLACGFRPQWFATKKLAIKMVAIFTSCGIVSAIGVWAVFPASTQVLASSDLPIQSKMEAASKAIGKPNTPNPNGCVPGELFYIGPQAKRFTMKNANIKLNYAPCSVVNSSAKENEIIGGKFTLHRR